TEAARYGCLSTPFASTTIESGPSSSAAPQLRSRSSCVVRDIDQAAQRTRAPGQDGHRHRQRLEAQMPVPRRGHAGVGENQEPHRRQRIAHAVPVTTATAPAGLTRIAVAFSSLSRSAVSSQPEHSPTVPTYRELIAQFLKACAPLRRSACVDYD